MPLVVSVDVATSPRFLLAPFVHWAAASGLCHVHVQPHHCHSPFQVSNSMLLARKERNSDVHKARAGGRPAGAHHLMQRHMRAMHNSKHVSLLVLLAE